MKSAISKKQLRDFSILIFIGFPLIIGFLIPFVFGHEFRIWTIFISLIAFFLGIFAPNQLYYPYKIWMLLGEILGWINSRLILGIIFYFVLLPISLVMKGIGYDPLKIKNKNQKTFKSYIKDRKIDLKRIF